MASFPSKLYYNEIQTTIVDRLNEKMMLKQMKKSFNFNNDSPDIITIIQYYKHYNLQLPKFSNTLIIIIQWRRKYECAQANNSNSIQFD